MENKPKPLKTYNNRHGTIKNQSGTIKTNPELYRRVMGGCRWLQETPRRSAQFSWQTHRQTLHHNIYFIIQVNVVSGSGKTPPHMCTLVRSSICEDTGMMCVFRKKLEKGRIKVLGGEPGDRALGLPGALVGFMPQTTRWWWRWRW